MNHLSGYFDREEKEVLRRTEDFNNTLTCLRYEGKYSRRKNIDAAMGNMRQLAQTLSRHWNLQEKVIFPFLTVHMPKKEAVVHFLRSDHRTIERSKKKLMTSLGRLSKSRRPVLEAGKIQKEGICLVSVLRHHIEMEKESVHKTIKNELNRKEKADVEDKVRKWLKRHKDEKRQ